MFPDDLDRASIKSWGYHYICDCLGCEENSFTKENIVNFLNELIEKIEMEAIGEPIIEYLCVDDEGKEGYSVLQLIATSNIAAHFVNSNLSVYFDVFSCKEFDENEVFSVIIKYFDPKSISEMLLTRDAEKGIGIFMRERKQ